MKLFIGVIIAATIIGGFVGGELVDRSFSITGAVVGGVGLTAILLGLGALFDAQERKRKVELTPEIRGVFDRTVGKLLAVQLIPKYGTPKEAFGSLMTNKRAAGYVFGFHDSLLQRLRLVDPANPTKGAAIMEQSYKRTFGEQAGFALYSMSVGSQENPEFHEARINGGSEVVEYLEKKTPALGLGRILLLGMKA